MECEGGFMSKIKFCNVAENPCKYKSYKRSALGGLSVEYCKYSKRVTWNVFKAEYHKCKLLETNNEQD